MAKLGYEIEYLAAVAGTAMARRLSEAGADRFAAALGDGVHGVWRARREVALRNMRLALGGEMGEGLIRETVKRVFENMARSLVEVSRFEKLGRDGARAIIQGEGLAQVEEARRKGKGCIVITAHYGNWELFGSWFGLMGHPTEILVGVQHNLKIHHLFNRFRHALGTGTIDTGVAARGVLRALRANKVVGIAGDQHSHTGLAIDFFGRKAMASRGPALFAVKAGAPLLPYVMRRERYDRHVMTAGEPLYPPESGDVERDIDEMTVAVNRFFEREIRKYPDQWMWTHRRWKASDGQEKEATFSGQGQ